MEQNEYLLPIPILRQMGNLIVATPNAMASESAPMLEGHVTINDTAEFDTVLAAQTEAAAGKPVYAVFVGTPAPETGKSW